MLLKFDVFAYLFKISDLSSKKTSTIDKIFGFSTFTVIVESTDYDLALRSRFLSMIRYGRLLGVVPL